MKAWGRPSEDMTGHDIIIHVNLDEQYLSYLPKSSLLTLETTLLSSACGGAPLTVFFLKPKNT